MLRMSDTGIEHEERLTGLCLLITQDNIAGLDYTIFVLHVKQVSLA